MQSQLESNTSHAIPFLDLKRKGRVGGGWPINAIFMSLKVQGYNNCQGRHALLSQNQSLGAIGGNNRRNNHKQDQTSVTTNDKPVQLYGI